MKKISLFACAGLFAAAGCASGDYEPWVTKGVNPPKPEQHDTFTLERTACFGVCPVYEVIVDDRDILEFRGRKFVTEEGGAVGERLPDGSYGKLLAIAAAYQFDAFDAAYPNENATNCPQRVTDQPSVIVGFNAGDRARTVSVYQGCIGFDGQDRFNAMIAEMDAVLDIGDLIGPREAFLGGGQ